MFQDPNDKSVYASAVDIVKRYTTSYAITLLASLLDSLDADRTGQDVLVTATGDMTGTVTVAHNLKTIDGKPAKPSTWCLVGFSGCDQANIIAADDVNITVKLPHKGVATFRLYQ